MHTMKRFSLAILVVLCVVFALAGCRKGAPVQNLSSPVPLMDTVPEKQIAEAIIRAGTVTGWEILPTGKGQMIGTLHVRSHMAEVDIAYDQKTYKITYRNSVNLEYKDGKIHPSYNKWVATLDQNIRREIARISK